MQQLISIITPSLNRADMIVPAIESVINQNYSNFEHIIMDGGSTDGTLEVLKRYPQLRVISAQDKSMYDAINKGFQIARGEIIGLLNTDDAYENNIFMLITDVFKNVPSLDAVVGQAITFKLDGNGKRIQLLTYPAVTPRTLVQRVGIGNPTINAWFFRKKFIEQIGPFDLTYRVSSDRDWMIRMALNQPTFISMDHQFYYYQQHPGSLTIDGINDAEADFNFECQDIAIKYIQKLSRSNPLSNYLMDWHSAISSEQIVTTLCRKEYRQALHYLQKGLRYNVRMPILLLRRTLIGLKRHLYHNQ